MLTRLARWWLTRKQPAPPVHVDECEVLGCDTPADHRLVADFDDDEALGVEAGGTLMAADYCAEHCPGGCRKGCPVRT